MSDSKFYNGTNHIFYSDNVDTVNILAGSGQKLNITCDTLSANTIASDGLIAEKIQVKAMSDDLGLNQLSNEQILPQNTSGIYEAQGISVAIMSSSSDPVRIVSGGPKLNSGGSSYGGALIYSSASGADFTGPVAYQASTFCDSYVGLHTDINEDGSFFVMSYSDPYVRSYKWNGTVYTSPQNIFGFTMGKVSGNYLLLTNEGSNLSVYFHNGTTWALQQLITTNSITLFDIAGSQLYYVYDGTLYIWSRSGTVWSQITTINLELGMDQLVNKFSVNYDGNLIAVLIDNTILKIYEATALVKTITESYIISICNNDNYIFYNDGSYISIVSKVSGTWTISTNKTALEFIDNMACNNNRLVCGRTIIDTYGRINVFNVNPYSNTLVVADEVSADGSYNLNVLSNYKDVNITGTNVNITNNNNGATYINGSLDVLNDLSVGGNFSFSSLGVGDGSAATPSIAFTNDSDTGIYSIGDGNIGMSLNGTKQFDLTSSSLTVPKLISSGPFFKLNMYSQTQVQSFLSAVQNAVEFGTTVLQETTGITRSAVTYSGAPNAGSRFTNSSGKTLKILACYSMTTTGGTNARIDVNFAVSGYPNVTFGRVTRDENGVGFSWGSSAMFVLAPGEYFDLAFICVPSLAVSTNTTNGAYLQIYTLN